MADGELAAIDPGALSLDAADAMIENVIGTFALPFAVAVNFCVDGVDTIVPMAIDKASAINVTRNVIISACRSAGAFVTKVLAIRLGDGTR